MSQPPLCSVTRPISWGEMDAFGHLNNVHYLRYAEDARIAFLNTLEFSRDELYSVVLKNECIYKKPVIYPDQLTTKAFVTQIGNSSFVMQYDIYSEQHACCVATASSVLVLVCKKSFEKRPLPAQMKVQLQEYMQHIAAA
jgi:acyl-CoA thioester hydrolase